PEAARRRRPGGAAGGRRNLGRDLTRPINLTRSAGAMGGMTLLSRIFSYIRDLLQAAILGAADVADAYVIAFRIPNLLRRLLGEGALTAAFVPVFTELRQRRGDVAGLRNPCKALKNIAVDNRIYRCRRAGRRIEIRWFERKAESELVPGAGALK
ncbi:MAG: lipid II flippase MurJ, partial [Pseudomonadota bacterium]